MKTKPISIKMSRRYVEISLNTVKCNIENGLSLEDLKALEVKMDSALAALQIYLEQEKA